MGLFEILTDMVRMSSTEPLRKDNIELFTDNVFLLIAKHVDKPLIAKNNLSVLIYNQKGFSK